MHFTSALALLAAAVVPALSTPTPAQVLEPRGSTCGEWDSTPTGGFIMYADLWGEDKGTGSQCYTINYASATSISWSTSWSWSGGSSNVKSFTNAAYQFTAKTLASINTIPTTWNWSYTGSNIVADVSYDTFLSSSAQGSDEYEIMVWLGSFGGAGPISSNGSPISSPTIGGATFSLYFGYNGSMKVYSFVANSNGVTSYSGDLKAFYTYLINSQGLSSSLYLLSVQAGTEPFTGSNAVLTTSSYTISMT